MQVVLLAAGNSTRFVPFNKTFAHKSLITIMGKTLLEHTLASIKNADIESVVIVVGPQSPIEKEIGNGEKFGLSIKYVTLPEALGMGAAIQQASEYLEEKFFVLNAYHLEFDQFAKDMMDLQNTNETVVLLGKKDSDFSSYGFMEVEQNKVKNVIEKPTEQLDSWFRVIGIYLLNKAFLKTLDKTPLEHYHFEKALAEYAKTDVRAVITEKKTITLKYAWDLFAVKDYLLENCKSYISPSAEISKNVIISGNVYIDDGATILDGAQIKGSCYIGKNAFIGTNSLIRNKSSVEEDAVAGSFLELKNTLLMANATTHTGVIEDSLVGRGCKIAAGIITANVRLDRKEIPAIVKDEKINTKCTSLGMIIGDKTQLGVRVTTMPGIIIGSNSLVGPYTVVMKNIPHDTKYFTKFEEVFEEKRTNGSK